MGRFGRIVVVVLLGLAAGGAGLAAGGAGQAAAAEPPWTVKTRILVTGVDATSDPGGVTFYSAVTVEAAVGRRLSRRFSGEILLANASHEVTTKAGGDEEPLGSVELLPLTATVQYRFRPEESVQPYLGAGGCLAVFWEKSGAWDSLDLPVAVSPAVQLGADIEVAERMLVNLDATWLWIDTDLEDNGEKRADLELDALLLSAGVGFRF